MAVGIGLQEISKSGGAAFTLHSSADSITGVSLALLLALLLLDKQIVGSNPHNESSADVEFVSKSLTMLDWHLSWGVDVWITESAVKEERKRRSSEEHVLPEVCQGLE
ncbi:uncharacterized protein LOC103187128 [Callorhinchus milii]|uniref:uncharacterized protein LOC103187128 n=1 Tax=Callorhinchus milii TaxID=7868 RepID=UPI001C3FF506|nr:uncharacterized protein LOC103187128 [Callorhinchus milii]